MSMIPWAVVDAASVVVRSGESSDVKLAKLQAMPGERLVLGIRGSVGDRIVDDSLVPATPVIETVTVAMVKAEQRRRLLRTDGYVTRSIDPTDARPIPDSVLAERAAIRAAADRLEAMNPIPHDYRASVWWGEEDL